MEKLYVFEKLTNPLKNLTKHVLLLIALIGTSSVLLAQANMYTASPNNDSLWVVDTTTLQPISSINLNLASGTVLGVTSLAVRPCTGEIFVSFIKSGVTNTVLGIVNPTTGLITEVGVMGNIIEGICFGSQNHMYAVSADAGSPGETLYKVDISTGTLTFFTSYGGGSDGETIEFCKDDGFIYHWSGKDTDPRMERTDTATGVTTIITTTGYAYDEVYGATYIGNGEFLTANVDQEFVVIDNTGFATLLTTGTAPNLYRGLGFPYTAPVITFTTSDVSCNGLNNGSIEATIPGGSVSSSSILISEVDPGSPDFIEITNVSGSPIDVSGMKVVVSDDYSILSDVNTITWNLSGTLASGAVLYREDVTGTNYWGNNLFWNSGSNSWAIIIDSTGAIVDALFWGWDSTSIANFSITVGTQTVTNNGNWNGPGINATCASTNSFTRVGTEDNDDASDWSTVAKTKGTANTALVIPFPTTNIYSWSTGATTGVITGLTPGPYSVTITDMQGCLVSGSDTITEPPVLIGNATLDSNTICVGTFNGGASTVVSGGLPPYSYSWSNGDTTSWSNTLGVGTNFVTISDTNNCSVIDSVIVDEIDTILPTVITQNISVSLNTAGNVIVSASQVDNGSFDNCAIQSISLDLINFNCSHIGPNTVTLTVTDTKGNQNTGTAVVTVEDNLAPLAFGTNITVYLDASGLGMANAASANNFSVDNCAIDSFYLSQMLFDCSDLGNNQVWFIAEDASGNKDSAQISVSVKDTISPSIICPNDTTFCEGIFNFSDPVGMDNCTPFVSQTTSYSSGTTFKAGNYVLSYKVTDLSGNTKTCSYNVESLPLPDVDLGNDKYEGTGTMINLVAGNDPSANYLWNDGSTDSTASFMLLSDTTVYVTVTSNNGCQASDTLNLFVLLGIDNGISSTANVKVYPNPTQGAFQIEISDWNSGDLNVSLYSADGKLIFAKSVQHTGDSQILQIEDESYSTGLYFLRISDGAHSSVSKIIVQ